MINAELARKQTDDNVVLKPILKNIEDGIYKASLNGKYETKIEIPFSNFNKICEILESFGYVCYPRSLTDIVEGCVLPERINKKAYVTISWKGDNQNETN